MHTLRNSNIIELIDVIEFIGDLSQEICKVVPFRGLEIISTDLLWISDKNLSKLKDIHKGNIICSEAAHKIGLIPTCNYFIVKNPRQAFQKVLLKFFVTERKGPYISSTAQIDPSVILGQNVFIGSNTVIESDCVIGDNSIIEYNNVIYARTKIGKNVKVGSNNTIGGVGFGYEKNDEGIFELIPHIGGVIIEDNVQIGNNTCIDRAVIGNTLLRKECKIDNHVHLAHGCEIGYNSLIIANSVVAGSTIVGDNVWISPGAILINGINIGNEAIVGLGAIVLRDVAPNSVVVGNPAKQINKKL